MDKKSRSTTGAVRCLNCLARFEPKPGADRAPCPNCAIEWRISWLNRTFPKIRGPVWKTYPNPEK
jgi:hypothetical protein